MAFQKPNVERLRGNVIRIHHPKLLDPSTYLTVAVSATGTSITVADNGGFTNGDLILYEGYGLNTAEIRKINGAVIDGTALTSTSVTHAHAIDCIVSKALFNQIEISGATTLTGTPANATLIDVNVSGNYTDYVLSTALQADSYIFVRYYNSLASVPFYSDITDAIPVTDFSPKTVGFIARNAFKNIGEKQGGRFDKDFVLDQIYLCELDVSKELKRWSWMETFDYDLGNITTGMRSVALPTDIEDIKTNKSILNVRIENDLPLSYIDKIDYLRLMNGVHYTTLATTATVGATTLVLTNSRDFEDTGSVNIAGTSYSYTGNTRSTNTLTGLTALATQIDSSADIWKNISFGVPTAYTVIGGYIYFDVPPMSDYSGRNIWIDYYKTIQRLDSDGDEIAINDPQIVISWLEIAIKKEKSQGEIAPSDISFIEYNRRKKLLINNEITGQTIKLVPQIPIHKKPINWR